MVYYMIRIFAKYQNIVSLYIEMTKYDTLKIYMYSGDVIIIAGVEPAYGQIAHITRQLSYVHAVHRGVVVILSYIKVDGT